MLHDNKKFWTILTVICALNLIGHVIVYPQLPDTIPIHWDAKNNINGWGPRYFDLVFGALPLLMLGLLGVLPKIDPKYVNYVKFKEIWHGFVLAITVLLIAISWLTEAAVFGLVPEGSGFVGMLVGGGVGALLIILGNYMPRVRFNYTFGIRTPWTLVDEHVWDRTHRMGGYVYIICGILMMVCGFFGSRFGNGATLSIVLILIAGSVWTAVYSWLVYSGKMK